MRPMSRDSDNQLWVWLVRSRFPQWLFGLLLMVVLPLVILYFAALQILGYPHGDLGPSLLIVVYTELTAIVVYCASDIAVLEIQRASFRQLRGDVAENVGKAWAMMRNPALASKVNCMKLRTLWVLDRGPFREEQYSTIPLPNTYVVPSSCYSCLTTQDLTLEKLTASASSTTRSGGIRRTTTRKVAIQLPICSTCRPLLNVARKTSVYNPSAGTWCWTIIGALLMFLYGGKIVDVYVFQCLVWKLFAVLGLLAIISSTVSERRVVPEETALYDRLHLHPARLETTTRGPTTLVLGNERYAEAFRTANARRG